MSFPTTALGPDNKQRSILVDANGQLVTDLAPKPATVYPIQEQSLRTDASGNLKVV